jgi:hypothetical protein
VDPVPDPLRLKKSGSAGNLTRTSRSVARNSGHYVTEAVSTVIALMIIYIHMNPIGMTSIIHITYIRFGDP